MVADKEGTPIQKNHYYPFGMAFAEGTTLEQGKQPYKYNGKELDQLLGLNLYDYSARYMDAAIGRFTTVDPLAEKYYSISPYAYVGNNPMRLTDPNGDSIAVAQSLTENFVLNHAFKLFASSKERRSFLADYASKGQTIYGHTFTKDGKYHKKGVNLRACLNFIQQ